MLSRLQLSLHMLQLLLEIGLGNSCNACPVCAEIRRARLAHKKGQMSDADYEQKVNEYMTYAVKEQERIGVDVLVHGEPERSDM